MRKNRDSFLLSNNRARIGVESKDSGQSTITRIDVIEAAKAYFQTDQRYTADEMTNSNEINVLNNLDRINDPNGHNDLNDHNKQNIDLRLWYVIQTKPGNEHRAEINLSNQGIETFLPLFESQQYCCGRMLKKIKPLFPNYLFARLDIELHYYKVKWTRGVSKILGNGGGPLPIPERVIEAIRERMGEDHLVRLEEEWKEGNIVQITSGPFKDLRGIFHRKVSDTGRVRIFLSLIGIDVPVQISQWQLKKVA